MKKGTVDKRLFSLYALGYLVTVSPSLSHYGFSLSERQVTDLGWSVRPLGAGP